MQVLGPERLRKELRSSPKLPFADLPLLNQGLEEAVKTTVAAAAFFPQLRATTSFSLKPPPTLQEAPKSTQLRKLQGGFLTPFCLTEKLTLSITPCGFCIKMLIMTGIYEIKKKKWK